MPALPTPTSRSLLLGVGGIVTAVLGLALGTQDAVWPALLLIALPLVALVVSVVRRPRVTMERLVTPAVVGAGDPATVTLRVGVRGSAVGTLVAEDDPGRALGPPHHLRLAAAPGQHAESTYTVMPRRRGRHTLDGFRYRFIDLLGLWVHTVRVPHATSLVATPRVVPLGPTQAHAYGASGETPIPQTSISGPDDVMVREYQARDDVRRIHWPSTARSGTLMVRREEAAWEPTAWLLLDSRAGVHPAGREDHPTFEWLVSIAASVGVRLLSDGFTVTLVDAEGVTHEVSAERGDGVRGWLDPLVDADLTGTDDLAEASAVVARSSAEHLLIALLGRLDAATADLLAATAGSRQQRLALVVPPADGDDTADHDAGRATLIDHGWQVREAGVGTDLGGLWLTAAGGVPR